MAETVVYLAIFETASHSFCIEYLPLFDGLIEIVSAHVTEKPGTPFQIRELDRRKQQAKGKVYQRRGLVLNEAEEHAESLQNVTRLEQLRLF
jgi:hypothetical protein